MSKTLVEDAGQFCSYTDFHTENLVVNILTGEVFVQEHIYQNAFLKLLY